MQTNPAVRLYQAWREIIRYQAEGEVTVKRGHLTAAFKEAREQGQAVDYILDNLEAEFIQSPSYYYWPNASLNYRLGLSVAGMSDRHIRNDPQESLWLGTFDHWEPVIRLQIRYNSRNVPIMTLWPNGDFRLDGVPFHWRQVYKRWTFLQSGWVAGRSVWTVMNDEDNIGGKTWVHIDETDFVAHRWYVPNHTFETGAHYRLIRTPDGQWKIMSQYGVPDGNYDFDRDPAAARLLESGYARCEKRYERYRRASEREAVPPRDKITWHIPKEGRLTGLEAVARFERHMRVYQPAEASKEAEHGSNTVGTSPVLHEGGVAPR